MEVIAEDQQNGELFLPPARHRSDELRIYHIEIDSDVVL